MPVQLRRQGLGHAVPIPARTARVGAALSAEPVPFGLCHVVPTLGHTLTLAALGSTLHVVYAPANPGPVLHEVPVNTMC